MAGKTPRAVIVGGSMAGLFAAHYLLRAGWDVHIYERTSGPLSGRGAGIMTHPELRTALGELGLDAGDGFGVPLQSRVLLDALDRVAATLSYPQISTSWTRVYSLLAKAFPAERYHAGAEIRDLAQANGGVDVVLADGRTVSADVLIGADGLRSSVRGRLFPGLAPVYAGYVAWRGLVDETDLDEPPFARASLFAFDLPPGEQMLGYPVAGPNDDVRPGFRRYNFVWYKPECDLARVMTDREGQSHSLSIPPHMIAPDVVADVRTHADRVLVPWFRKVVACTQQPFLQPIYDLAVPSMADGRVALIGDAAFVVRPHVGAGVVKAADDARALAEALADGDDIAARLQRFSTARHAVGSRMIEQARRLGSHLRYAFDSDAERRAANEVRAPATMLRETASLDFLHSPSR